MTTKATLSRSSSTSPKISKIAAKSPPARGGRDPQYLFGCWEKIGPRIRRARRVVVFLDFDGTLVRLRRKPLDVFLGKKAKRLLHRLARHRRVTLCLISGRELNDLRLRTGVEGAIYFGLHGWERSSGPAPDLPGARRLREEMQWVRRQIRALPGIRVQDKGVCFGLHYRTARKPAVEKARAIVDKVLDRLGPGFSLLAGKKIWEIYPSDMGSKGKAAKELLQQIPGRKLAVYAGDDTTDETAFALLPNGVTIRVGKFQHTQARYFLRNPAEVLAFLARLEEALS